MSLFGLLREAIISATYLLSAWMRAKVSLDRITGFLTETEDLDDEPVKTADQPQREGQDAAVVIEAGTELRFSKYREGGFTLRLNGGDQQTPLIIPRGKTTVVAGDVGSGKSAFLLAVLGELHLAKGSIELCKEDDDAATTPYISYAAQSPWLQGKLFRLLLVYCIIAHSGRVQTHRSVRTSSLARNSTRTDTTRPSMRARSRKTWA